MSDSKVNGVGKKLAQCHHQRLLERVSDCEGNKTDMMKCCECGSIVHQPAQKTLPSSEHHRF